MIEVKEILNYDKETGIFTYKVNYKSKKAGDVAGYINNRGYVQINLFGRIYSAHRLAWYFHNGEMPTKQIDHINGIRHDNNIANLRNVDLAENLQNQRNPQKGNTSGFLGVTFHKNRNKWMAQINHKKKNIYIGIFSTAIEAHNAYLSKKREIHEFCTI